MIANALLLALLQQGPVVYVPGQVAPGEKMLAPMMLAVGVDAGGKAGEARCEEDVPAVICPRLLAAASHWTFTPGKVDGKAAAFRLRLAVRIRATPAGGDYTLAVAGVDVQDLDGPVPAEASTLSRAHPEMPASALRSGRSFVVEVRYSVPPGKDKPKIEKVWVNGRQGGDPVSAEVARAARVAVGKWRFAPGDGRIESDCVTFTMSTNGPLLSRGETCQRVFAPGYAVPALATRVEGLPL